MMKKLFVLLFLLCVVVKGMAQQDVRTLRFEPHLGVSFTNLINSGLDTKNCWILGVGAQYQLDEKFGVVTGLNYSTYGAKDNNASLNLGYIEVPLLAKIYVYNGFSVHTGVELGYNVYDGRTDFLLFSEANKFAAGIPVGVGYDFKHFTINAQYYFGLTKAYKDFSYKNRGVKITLGYKI